MALGRAGRARRANSSQCLRARRDARSVAFAILDAMSNRQARRQQNRQARRQATSYRGGRSGGSSQGGGNGGDGGGSNSGGGLNSLDWRFIALAAVVAIAALVVVFVVQPFSGGGDSDEQVIENLSAIDQALADLPAEMQDGNKLGSDDAPVKMIQYEDFQCGFCLGYTLNNEPFLVEEFVKPGLLQIEFRHYPLVGLESLTAAVGASCAAEQDRMFEYANRLFAKQAEDGFRPDQGVFAEENLVAIAGELGLDTEAFAACQVRPDALSPVANNQAAAQAIGFRGTPNFVLNGAPVQNRPNSNERWREIIQELIDAVTAEDEAGAEGETGAEGESDAGDDATQ